jgi:hypothetical protein
MTDQTPGQTVHPAPIAQPDTDPAPVTEPDDDELEPDHFPDEGSGPEDPDEVDDPANHSAANAIRASSIERNRDRGDESTFERR